MTEATTTAQQPYQALNGARQVKGSHAKLAQAVADLLQEIVERRVVDGEGSITFPIHQGGIGTIKVGVTRIIK